MMNHIISDLMSNGQLAAAAGVLIFVVGFRIAVKHVFPTQPKIWK